MDHNSRDELRIRLNQVIWADTHGKGSSPANNMAQYKRILYLLQQLAPKELYDSHKVYSTVEDSPLELLSEIVHNQISFDHRFAVGAPEEILEGLNDDWEAPQPNLSNKWRNKWLTWRLKREIAGKKRV